MSITSGASAIRARITGVGLANPDSETIKQIALRYLENFYFNMLVASPLVPRQLRWILLRAGGLDVQHAAIDSRGFYRGRAISIGRGTHCNVGVWIEANAPVVIGERCGIGHRAMFLTSGHAMGDAEQRSGSPVPLPITVGDGVWIGAQSLVLPGVTIGDGCVIAAGAVVTTDCEENGLYAGVPARLVRPLA